jgi:site-specific DNA recombinase
MKGAVGYFRVSTKEQAAQNNSLPVQEGKFKGYCTSNSLPALCTFIDKQSARNANDRTQFQAMLSYCQKHRKEVSCVVVADLSRFARNVADQAQTISTLAQLGIKLVSIDEPHIDSTAAGKLSAGMIGVFNQFFSDSLSEKTKDRMKAAVKAGRFVWVSPVGYVNSKNGSGSIIKPDPERAALVRKGFELMAKGIHAADDVLRTVTALGLTTRKGRYVPKQTWHAILRNPIYAGWVKSGDLIVRGLHKPIVSQDLFDTVQDVLAGRSKTAQPRQRVHPGFPLRQFIKCAKCGKGLTAGVVKKKFPYYWCYTKGCRDVLVSTEELEKNFVRLLGMHQPTVELLEQLPEIAARQWAAREERTRQESRALTIRLDEQRRLNSDAIKAKLKGELTKEDFDTVKQSITEETTKIEKQLSALESEQSMMQELMEQSQRDIIDLVSARRKADTSGKRELQTALFPDGLVWSHESGFLNSQNTDLMQKIQALIDSLEEDIKVGVPDGI